jgi:holo-[acyl-carrier protein] synthase
MIKAIGVDIVQHNRVNEKIARKILTKKELLILEKKANKIEYLASRFAAKEAIIKATNKKYLFKDIEVLNTAGGSPYCNIKNCKISISHEKNYSIAFCILEEE